MTEVAEPVLCLRHKEYPRGVTSAVAVLPFGTKSFRFVPSTHKEPIKVGFQQRTCSSFLPPLLLCLRQLQQQIPFPAAPKKDTNTSRDVKNLLYAGVHSMAKSTYRLMPCTEPRWTHTKLELIPSSRVFPLFSIILHSE